MSSPPPDSAGMPSDPTLAWDMLAERVEAFINAWDSGGGPPNLAEFAPEKPAQLRRLTLVELIKVDLEYRAATPDWAKRVEQYGGDFPELDSGGGLPCDLIYEEYHLRKLAGEAVDPQEYFERFPQRADELGRLLGLEGPEMSTVITAGVRAESIEVGTRLDEFDLLTRLGRGAFATVFMARQESMQRIVALKVSADRGCEPQTMSQLDHPYIVRVFDQRRLPEQNLRLMYMQYVPGGTLQSVVETVRTLPVSERAGSALLRAVDEALINRGESPPSESHTRRWLSRASWPQVVCWLGARLASALDYAHGRGVLHRDIKPANVLVAADGTPKLADFNISFNSKVEGATAAAYFGGSLAYMSPEQLEACNPSHDRVPEELDSRSDIYSLGVMLWELLTGTRPFGDEDIGGDWAKTLERMTGRRRLGVGPSALSRLPANCPPGLEEVLLGCLSPNVADRPPTAGHLARQLELCLHPQVQRLLRPRGSWRRWAQRHPLPAAIAAGVVPNLVMSGLNLSYNIPMIVNKFGHDVADVFYSKQVSVINSIAYGLALAILIPFAWPMLRAVRRITLREATDDDLSPRWMRRCFYFADCVAGVTAIEWAVSGIVFPVWLLLEAREREEAWGLFLHFFTSQVLMGAIAATLVFFVTALLSMRVYYPALLGPDTEQPDALEQMRRLTRRTWIYFIVALTAPFLSPVLLALVHLIGEASASTAMPTANEVITASAILCVLGIVNAFATLRLMRAIQRDVGSLAIAASPPGENASMGDTVSESFLSSTART